MASSTTAKQLRGQQLEDFKEINWWPANWERKLGKEREMKGKERKGRRTVPFKRIFLSILSFSLLALLSNLRIFAACIGE